MKKREESVWKNAGSTDAGPQCMQINGSGWSVSSNTDGGGGSYPEEFKGCHWGIFCTDNSGMPVKITSIGSMPSS